MEEGHKLIHLSSTKEKGFKNCMNLHVFDKFKHPVAERQLEFSHCLRWTSKLHVKQATGNM